MRKILDALTIVTTILVLGILGGGFFTYKYVTSEQFKAKMMNQVLENVQGLMPNILENSLPSTTGKSYNDIKKYHKELDKNIKKPEIIEKGNFGEDGWSISIGDVEDGDT